MTNDEVKEYIRRTGKFPAGRTRCMDCRCTGKGECPGETYKQQTAWRKTMEDEYKL